MARSLWTRGRIVVSRVFVAGVMILAVTSTSKWDSTAPIMGSLWFLAGTLLVGVASLGRLWCSLYIAGRKTKTLVTFGPYSLCRHPLYFFSFLGMAGVGLATETLSLPLLLIIGFVVYYPRVMQNEERKLKLRYGEAYEDYACRVPRFFPRISGLLEPEEYPVNPVIYRVHIFSALWFIWLTGIAEVIEELHELKWLPHSLQLY